MTISNERSPKAPSPALDAAYRDLVGIHASVAEALSNEKSH